MIEAKQIGSIKCEITKDAYRNIYHDLPDNSESGFNKLLEDHYDLVAVGKVCWLMGDLTISPTMPGKWIASGG